MDPRRSFGRFARVSAYRLVVVVAGVLAVMVPATAASAEPSVSELEAQIDAQWNKLEPVIEEYNLVHSSLKTNKAKVTELENTLKPLQLQIDLALSRVGGMAAESYKTGSESKFSALLVGGSPASFLDQLSFLNQITRLRLAEVSEVKELRDKFLADKKALDELVNQLNAQDADLANKKKDIEAQIASLQKLRLQAYGTTAALGDLRPVPCPSEYPGGAAGTAVNKACAQIGDKYVYGSEGPNTFDCSGLTKYAWLGTKTLPHNAAAQYSATTRVSRANLRAGDLIFYGSPIHHVAMYIGAGYMVHAPRAGDVVRVKPIDYTGTPSGYGRVA